MTGHKKFFHTFRVISLCVLFASLIGCATGSVSRIEPPGWFVPLSEGVDGDCYYLPVRAESDSREAAAGDAAEMVLRKLLSLEGLSDLYNSSADQQRLKEEILGLFYPDNQPGAIPVVLEQSEWIEVNGFFAFFGYFCISSDAAEQLEAALKEQYFGEDEALGSLLEEAVSFEENGLLYQAAESYLRAASRMSESGTGLTLSMAEDYLRQAYDLFSRIDMTIQQYPTRVTANSRVDQPFTLRCMEGIVGVRDVEFLVQYRGKKRDGGIGTFEVRLVSDVDGYVSFYHPFLPFAGDSEVVMSPGSRDVRTILRQLEGSLESAGLLKDLLEEQVVSFPFTVESAARTVPTGIVVLHTDMTGTDLNSSETAFGLREVLLEDGFDTEIMNLSPQEITAANEASFLRDLKAAYGGQYTRVIFGVVGINDFDIRNDLYKVETGGVLKVVDVQTGEILMILEESKSVESQDNALAVAASFRELGRAFAEEMKDTLY